MYMKLSGLSVTSLLPTILLIFLSSEQGLHHPAFLCVGMGYCEKYGTLIGFAIALKCFVGLNLSCICCI